MRAFGHAAVGICFAALAFDQLAAQSPDAQTILQAARQALGGNQRLAAIKTFVATGRTRQIRGENLVPIEFEISCELPDKYIRRDEFPVQDLGPTTAGFNGDTLIRIPSPPAPIVPARPGGALPGSPQAPDEARTTRVATVKQDFARLMLGLFAGSFSSVPLTFAYVGIAEAPQGQADVLEAKGPDNFLARLFISKTTQLPIMVSWHASPADSPAPGIPAQGTAPGTAPSTNTAETRLYFADYRDADGVNWPFRIRRAVGADTVEETNFDRYRINAKIDPKKFEVK